MFLTTDMHSTAIHLSACPPYQSTGKGTSIITSTHKHNTCIFIWNLQLALTNMTAIRQIKCCYNERSWQPLHVTNKACSYSICKFYAVICCTCTLFAILCSVYAINAILNDHWIMLIILPLDMWFSIVFWGFLFWLPHVCTGENK